MDLFCFWIFIFCGYGRCARLTTINTDCRRMFALKMIKHSRGRGLINSLINKLPVELHIPGGYQWCGPGTKIDKRLRRGDPGINKLDASCKEHDLAYANHSDLESRHKADAVLQEKAWQRVKSKDASFGEKAAALLVTNVMKAKRKMGMGIKKQKAFGSIVRESSKAIKKLRKPITLNAAAKTAILAAKRAINDVGGKQSVRRPRVISIPTKTGGIIPFLPAIFGGLSALGALTGGAAGVVKTIQEVNAAKDKLKELQRHNKHMEEISLKRGNGLYLRHRKNGMGLYLTKRSKNL